MRYFHLIFSILLGNFIAITGLAQNRYWVFPPNYVDIVTGQVYSLPSTATEGTSTTSFVDLINGTTTTIPSVSLSKANSYVGTYPTTGGVGIENRNPKTANGIFADDGSLRFYLNNKVFVAEGKTVLYTASHTDDAPIIPVPGKCGYYYLIQGRATGAESTLYYREISEDGTEVNSSSVSGAVSNYYNYAVSPVYINSSTDLPECKLYTFDYIWCNEFTVAESGITYQRSFYMVNTVTYLGGIEAELSPNGKYLGISFSTGGGSVPAIVIIDLTTLTRYKYFLGSPIVGLEFSAESDRVFFTVANENSSSYTNKVGYFAFDPAQGTEIDLDSEITTWLSGSGSYGGSFLERSIDDYIYLSNGTSLIGFDENNLSEGFTKFITVSNPSSTITINSTTTYYNLIDQIDNMDYDHPFKVGYDLTKTYSNVNSGNGSLPVLSKAAQTITAQTNVTVSSGTSVIFKAGDQISLKPGFTVSVGGKFNGALEEILAYETDYCSEGGRIATRSAGLEEELGSENTSLISIFPNPSSGLINIRSRSEIASVQLMDIQGKVLIEEVVSDEQVTIDATSLNDDIYLVKVRHAGGVTVQKLILSH